MMQSTTLQQLDDDEAAPLLQHPPLPPPTISAPPPPLPLPRHIRERNDDNHDDDEDARPRRDVNVFADDDLFGDDDDGGYGSDEDSLSEEHHPSNPPHRPTTFRSLRSRRPQDRAFTLLFLTLFTFLILTSTSTLLRTSPHDKPHIDPNPVFSVIARSWIFVVLVAGLSGFVAMAWLVALGAWVEEVVWGTVVGVPVASLGLGVYVLTDALMGARSGGDGMSTQYNAMVLVGVMFFVVSVTSAGFLLARRREIDATIRIVRLSCTILWENPTLFVLSFTLLAAYLVFALAWMYVFAHVFNVAPAGTSMASSSVGAVVFFVFMFFWTGAVLQNLEKMTIATVVGAWYFRDRRRDDGEEDGEGQVEEDVPDEEDLTVQALRSSLGPGFGTVAFAALVVAIAQTLHYITRMVRRHAPQSNLRIFKLALRIVEFLARATSDLLGTITGMSVMHAALTGRGLVVSSRACARLFRRNLVFGVTSSVVTRVVLGLGAGVCAAGIGAVVFFFAAVGGGGGGSEDNDGSARYAYVVGLVGAVVPFYVLRFVSQIVQHTVDATFLCFMIDLDSGRNSCQEAHAVFEPAIAGAPVSV